ncbi:alpha beta hydrolase fold protein [Phlyctema vagabunda]|uniref:Alpha beta hydrolase fold protein n=1 Tax=Phlyctema vagabunda TaxID=108571 RepID=A0ABR4PZI0_9HELO
MGEASTAKMEDIVAAVFPTSKPTKAPLIQKQSNSIFHRLFYFLVMITLRIVSSIFLYLTRTRYIQSVLPKQPFHSTSGAPTLQKVYSIRPSLAHRIFVPSNYQADEALVSAPLPVYIDIHGGGYAFCDAAFDDEFCYGFSNANRMLVISISYRKAPFHRFPTQINDLVAVIQELCDDVSLPIDRSRIVIGGASAGGNLALAVAQMMQTIHPGLIKAVLALYPVCDYTKTVEAQLASRPKDSGSDPLTAIMNLCAWGYIPQGQDLRDPLVSVALARKEELPPRIFLIGCELDLMCSDVEKMAEKLGSEGPGERSGTELCWQQNGVRWEKILDHRHGFDQFPASGERGYIARRRGRKLRDDMASWIFREVFV